MYCPVNNEGTRCPSRCCRLYNIALAFLAGLILFVIGLLFGANFATVFTAATAILITAAVILFIVFIVTLLTRGCCQNNNYD